ncbi:M28 family metallopeptidase [Nonomuraea sp. NPDC046570]|uniref:M28 family metallopeptidase n=1 Tax=Nonomuraea sp. NPDC046570 TaxID=3155255 RepID=UPI0033E891E7
MVRALAVTTAVALPLTFVAPANASPVSDVLAHLLTKAVKPQNVKKHLTKFQEIAEANGGSRHAGSPGYEASVAYVSDKLRKAGYKVTYTNVEFPINWEELAPPVLERTAPSPKTYATPADFVTVASSGSGDVTKPITVVDPVLPPTPAPSSTAGCEASDFAGFPAGNIALIQRGTCPFVQKANNAKAAGAGGVIFFNEGQPGRTDPYVFDIGEWRYGFPVVFTSFAVGNELASAPGTVVHLKTTTKVEVGTSTNVIADSRWGNPNEVVMVGAHLDGVPEGPGINDNGSGSAAILETALQLKLVPTKHRVRFAFWAAEELGLLGSDQYVEGLSQAERDKIRLYLNFDMVASPNYGNFLYDGDDSDGAGSPAGPPGSDAIEKTLEKFYGKKNIKFQGTDFDGRSDYGAFIDVGIPAGGIFTGAEVIKTPEQAALFGGTAGVAFDACYHAACDNITNINMTALDFNSDAIAYSTATYAFDLSGIPDRNAAARSMTAQAPSPVPAGAAS